MYFILKVLNHNMQPIDIIIATYNRRELLEQMIREIEERTKTPYRLIVVDNHSTADDTVDYVQQLKKEGKIDVCLCGE